MSVCCDVEKYCLQRLRGSSPELLGPYLNTSRYLSSDIGPVPLSIKPKRFGQHIGDVIGGKGPLQLRAVNSPGGLDLSAESSAQRKRVQPQVGAGLKSSG